MKTNLDLLAWATEFVVTELEEAIAKSGKDPSSNRHVRRLRKLMLGTKLICSGKGDSARDTIMEAIDE